MQHTASDKERSSNKPWEAELERVNRALRVVSKTNRSLLQVEDVVTWLNHVCHTAVDIGGYRMAAVGFAEEDARKTVRVVASAGYVAGYFDDIAVTWADEPHGRGPSGTAIRTGQPFILRNIPDDPRFEPWRQQAMKRGYAARIAVLTAHTDEAVRTSCRKAGCDDFATKPLTFEMLLDLIRRNLAAHAATVGPGEGTLERRAG